jgi:hypothetical protein
MALSEFWYFILSLNHILVRVACKANARHFSQSGLQSKRASLKLTKKVSLMLFRKFVFGKG